MDDYTYRLFQKAKKSGNLEEMKKLFEVNKHDVIIRFEYAKMLFNNKRFNEARDIFLTLLNTRNRNYAMLELGKLEFGQGNIELARGYFKDLLNTPNWTYAKLELGRLEFSQGNIELARSYFEDLLNTQNNMYAMLELGRLEFSQGNVEKARSYFEGLLNTQNKNYAMFELGRLEFSQNNVEKARGYFEKLLNSQCNTYALICLVNLCIKQNDYLSAFEYFKYLEDVNLSFDLKGCVEALKLYLMIYLNIYFKKANNMCISYNNNQALDYDEYVAVEHIIERHKADFSSDIDIYKVFNDIRCKISEEYKVRKLSINDIYDIPYENVGDNCHVLRVVTLPNTKDILTMYPLDGKNYNLDSDSEEPSSLRLQRKKY